MFNQNPNDTKEFMEAIRIMDNSTLEQLIQQARRLNMSEQDISSGIQILNQLKNKPR